MSRWKLCVFASFLLAIFSLSNLPLRADVGIVLYESKGVDSRRTSSGHMGLVVTDLCTEGIDALRPCIEGEDPGVVVTRYANVAAGYARTVFVAPFRDHFMATAEAGRIPVLSNGAALDAMQMEYWREHLRPYLPPLSEQRYQELKHDLEKFDAGRTFRRALTMELLMRVLAPQKKTFPTEPIAMIDPVTRELIPNGRWREAIGAAHVRSSMVITVPATRDLELRLIALIASVKDRPFQALTDNCSDFVEEALLKVFEDSGLRFRPRLSNAANAWITSPIEVGTEFLNFAKRQDLPLTVTVIPMLAGTRRTTTEITSIGRGALVPDPSQGKLAFGLKIYINTLNPLLGLTAFSVDKLSRFADLKRLAHERGGGDLSRIAAEITRQPQPSSAELKMWRREQVRVFGTTACWKAKQQEFDRLTAQAQEVGLLNAAERSLVLKPGRPFLLPRLYEQVSNARGREGMLLAGMLTDPASAAHFLAAGVLEEPGRDNRALVPGRPEIREMASSENPADRLLAFKLMTCVVNYDLSAETINRRNTQLFDQDWKLFMEVAEKNDLRLAGESPAQEPLEGCSCRQFDEGKADSDAFQNALGFWSWFGRERRTAAYGPSR